MSPHLQTSVDRVEWNARRFILVVVQPFYLGLDLERFVLEADRSADLFRLLCESLLESFSFLLHLLLLLPALPLLPSHDSQLETVAAPLIRARLPAAAVFVIHHSSEN